jgi:uncharacterized protein
MIALLKSLNVVTQILIIVGALNWGLIGFFSYNLVGRLFGDMSNLSIIVYAIVGLSGVYQIVRFRSVSACLASSSWTSHTPSTAH